MIACLLYLCDEMLHRIFFYPNGNSVANTDQSYLRLFLPVKMTCGTLAQYDAIHAYRLK